MGYRSNAILQCCACTPKRALFSRLATIFFGIFFLSSAAIAQPNNPFGAPPNAGGAPAAAPNPGQPNTADAPAQETDLAIKILLDQNPTEPQPLAEAIRTCVQLGREDVARKFMRTLIDGNFDATQLAPLTDVLDAVVLHELAMEEELQPEGAQLSNIIRQAIKQRYDDTSNLDQILTLLESDKPSEQQLAIEELRRKGTPSVIALADMFKDPTLEDRFQTIRRALVIMGSHTRDPLVGYLGSSHEAQVANVIEVLSYLRETRIAAALLSHAIVNDDRTGVGQAARKALVRLVGTLPSNQDAEEYLRTRLNYYLEGNVDALPDANMKVAVWNWDNAAQSITIQSYDVRVGSLIDVARVAADLYKLDPENEEYRLMHYRSLLEETKVTNGLDNALDMADGSPGADAASHGVGFIVEVLESSLADRRFPAAIAATEILGDIGSTELVAAVNGQPSLLVEIAQHPNRRLRLAATEAILKLDPQQPFAGSTFVGESLAYFVSTAGVRKVLTGDVTGTKSQFWIGLLGQMGYSGDRATTGRDLVFSALRSSDYEFILVGETIQNPPIQEVVQLLRSQPRTAEIPIAIVSDNPKDGAGARISKRDDATFCIASPNSVDSLLRHARRFLQTAQYQGITINERFEQSERAIRWATMILADSKYEFYNLQRHTKYISEALFTPNISSAAAEALQHIPSPVAQKALVLLASNPGVDVGLRKTAAKAFKESIDKHGTLLTRPEVLAQYDLYNRSLGLDDATIDILGFILDAMEARVSAQPETNSDSGE